MRQVDTKKEVFKHLSIPTNIIKRLDEIVSFKLFKGLSEKDLEFLLKCAQIHKFEEKKQLLSLQDDPSFLYALFSGEAKVFCSSEDGRESIVSIAGKGETILENAVLFNKPSLVSCSVLTAGEFMTIPALAIRELAKKSVTFSNNLSTILVEQNTQLIFQFEEITLQTAVHRVGSYLLQTKISKGAIATEFDLDHEKSLIASYLGMTPETFSRTLGKLRCEGVDVHKRHVTMESSESLCKYHNTAYDFGCPHWKTSKCPKHFS